MAAVATINPNTGAVDSVQITNMGQNTTTPYDPVITFTGGLNYSEILITAEVEDLDNSNSVSAVSFYVNGTLMDDSQSIDSNPDAKAPYQILWSPDGPGIFTIYAAAEDSDGNVYTSPVIRREAFLSQPPYVEFNPMDRAYGYVMPENIDENGSIITSSAEGFLPIESLLNLGTGYHSFPRLEFVDAQSVGFSKWFWSIRPSRFGRWKNSGYKNDQ